MLNRRDLLKSLGTGVAAIAVPVAVNALPESRDIWWSGWRYPANQMIHVGWWAALVSTEDRSRNILVATTMGGVQRCHECDCVDLYLATKDWPVIGPWATDDMREYVKTRALANLKKALREL